MYKLKKFVNKILNKYLKLKRNKLDNHKKIFITKKENNIFKKRKKQLSLNLSKINFFKISSHNKIILFILIWAIIIWFTIFLFFWPYFKIKNINIIKEDEITNITIAYKWIDYLRWKSIFSIDNEDILKKLISYQQNIKNIQVSSIYPNTLKITIWSYNWIFNTNQEWSTKNYIVVENGTLVPSKINKELKTIKIINNNDESFNTFLDYKKVYEEKYIKNIEYLIKKIEENIIDIKILNLTYYVIEREVHIKIKNNILIYSLDDDLDEQIEKTVIFNKQHHQLKNEWIYYTDLRIASKIFYCPSEEKNICTQNIKSIYDK